MCVCLYVCVLAGLLCEVYRQVDTPVSLQFFGVDISEGMAARARNRECYNRVVHSEVCESCLTLLLV
jgi:predicted TPR repeat methyltransferase